MRTEGFSDRMNWFDRQPREVRDIINEYGLEAVRSLQKAMIKCPHEMQVCLIEMQQEL